MISGKDVAETFDLAVPPELFPSYNVAPTQPVLAVRAADVGREAALLRPVRERMPVIPSGAALAGLAGRGLAGHCGVGAAAAPLPR
jgi:hypothetical protein